MLDVIQEMNFRILVMPAAAERCHAASKVRVVTSV
jgi:hypothetical protein